MDDAQQPHERPGEDPAHVGPPDLILQAIVPPTDAPAEIRAAVANRLADLDLHDGCKYGWEDVSFAASAIALVEGTNQRADPGTQWVFAISAESPRLGEQLHASGSWAGAIQSHSHARGDNRVLWRVSVFDAVRTAPRSRP